MAHRCKKYLSLLLTVALINSSIQPLYASFPEREDDVVRETKAQARMMMVEEALQAKLKTTASFVESWTPSFIKKAVSKLGTWVESTLKDLPPSYFAKSPLEIDYVRDRAYWLAHFSTVVDEIKGKGLSSDALHARLTELQDMVMQGVLSPYAYEKGLKEIEASGLGNQSLLKNTREEFKKALKTAPGFIDQTFRQEASLYIQDLLTGRGDAQEFISHIRYYRDIDNALDYKNTLTSIRSYLRENKKALKITQKDYNAVIATLNTEIEQTSKAEKKRHKTNQAFSLAASSVLPYFGQDWDELTKPTNNALAEPSKMKGIIENYLDASTKALYKLVHTGTKYVQEHPTQVLIMALATQVAAAAAYQTFIGSQLGKGTIGQANSQDASFEEDTALPTLSLLKRTAKRNIRDEFQINQITGNDQNSPAVEDLANDNVFVAWQGRQTGDYDIYARVFAANGIALVPEFSINQNTNLNQASPSAVSLMDGNIFVIWDGQQTGNWDIYGRIFSANGTALMPEFEINQNTTADQSYPFAPSVARLTNGDIFVAWQGAQSGNSDVYGRIFAPNGTALMSNDLLLNENANSNQGVPSITALKNGNLFASWVGDQSGLGFDIYGRIFAANGTALIPYDLLINVDTAADQYFPFITTLATGNIFAAWQGQQKGDYDIYGRIFADNGAALSNEFLINQNTTLYQGLPSVAVLSDGNALVTWIGNQRGEWDIYGRVFSPNALTLSNEFSLQQILNGTFEIPAVASLSNGNIFMAWKDAQSGYDAVYGRILTPSILEALETTTTSSFSTMTTLTTSSFVTPQPNSNSSSSGTIFKAIIGSSVGGSVLIVGSALGYLLYKRSKHCSRASAADTLELQNNSTSKPFEAVSEGVKIQYDITGQLRDGHYRLLTDIGPKIAKSIADQTGIKISFERGEKLKSNFTLGGGQFGSLLIAKNLDTNEFVGAKQIKSDEKIRASLKEGEIQAKLNHPNVMPLLDYINFVPKTDTDEDDTLEPVLYQFMPLAGFGNGLFFQKKLALLDNLNIRKQVFSFVAEGLLKGLDYLHKQRIFHLDFKNTNFVIDRTGVPKIIDFGCAIEAQDSERHSQGSGDTAYFSVGRFDEARYLLGIDHPEKADHYSPAAADAWAFGVTLVEVWTDKHPFDATMVRDARYREWTRTYFTSKIEEIEILKTSQPGSIMDMIKKLLIVEDQNRLRIKDAVKLLPFNDIKSTLESKEERIQLFQQLKDIQEQPSREGVKYAPSNMPSGVADFYTEITQEERDQNYQ